MKRVIERDELGPQSTPAREGRPWWQTCRVEDFKAICERKTEPELQALTGEIRGLVAKLQAQIEAPGPNGEHLHNLRRAHGHIAEKARIARGLLAERSTSTARGWRARQDVLVKQARAAHAAGRFEEALLRMIEALEVRKLPDE